jgi:hypothetical protein
MNEAHSQHVICNTFVSVTPPKLFFELPTKYVKNTFVGFVLPNKKNENSFFESLVNELKDEQTKIKETNEKERSFQEIFEAVKENLEDKVEIETLNDFGEIPIYLFEGNNNERYYDFSFPFLSETALKQYSRLKTMTKTFFSCSC